MQSTNQRSNRMWWVIATVGGMLFVLPVAVLMFGSVNGEEFDPGHFKRRTFHYLELPIARIQVWPVSHMDITSDLEKLLIAKNYVADSIDSERSERWDLIRYSRAGGSGRRGDAHILCRYFDAFDHDGTKFWLIWTKEHPGPARIFWPVIAELAQDELYVLLPDLFELAAQANDSAELNAELDAKLAQDFEALAKIQREMHDYESAINLYSRALEHDLNREACLTGRRYCRDALEKKQ